MSTEVIVNALNILRLGLSFIPRQEEDISALDVLTTGNLASLGLSGEVLQVAQLGRAALTYLNARGIVTAEAVSLIAAAEDEDRDVTTDEVQAHLNTTQDELDDTQAEIDAMGTE